jgi:hypothetical protein
VSGRQGFVTRCFRRAGRYLTNTRVTRCHGSWSLPLTASSRHRSITSGHSWYYPLSPQQYTICQLPNGIMLQRAHVCVLGMICGALDRALPYRQARQIGQQKGFFPLRHPNGVWAEKQSLSETDASSASQRKAHKITPSQATYR